MSNFIKKILCGAVDVVALVIGFIWNGIKKFFGFVFGILRS